MYVIIGMYRYERVGISMHEYLLAPRCPEQPSAQARKRVAVGHPNFLVNQMSQIGKNTIFKKSDIYSNVICYLL